LEGFSADLAGEVGMEGALQVLDDAL